ncbi:hypothetical protein [Paracoccus zhejiangensis]|uniref:SARP family transcriptional regulator n=1 Tax=Paracoccus zhejiangensis TaxID=1077935 RepID=A0A2H5F4T1_9RHOB|nr:hypothetical protein [Paracoccus zhejiangensis]AUH66545.1 hypothetical protein CX676_19750 [Paracoccus zhejiangensis]
MLMIRLRLYGPMAVLAEDGTPLTPKGMKTQALVALIALAPDMRRSRVWLQDRLWSDRDEAQASASLRQAVYQLRQSLGSAGALLHSDRQVLSFDPSRIAILPPEDGPDSELLQGIDIRDPEFEHWLNLQRMADQPAPQARATRATERPTTVQISVDRTLSPDLYLLGQLVADMFAQALEERALTEVRLAETEESADFELALMVFPGDRCVLRGQLLDRRSHRLCWSRMMTLRPGPGRPFEQAGIARFVNAGIEAAWKAQLDNQSGIASGNRRIHMAVRRMFSYRLGDLAAAEDLLRDLPAEDATVAGWRMMLRLLQVVERARPADGGMIDEVEGLLHDALLYGPANSMALSGAANACLHILDRTEDGLALARRAVQISPSNPFAYDALTTGLLRLGRFEAAYRTAVRASYIAEMTQAAHFFDMGRCLAALVTNRMDEARKLANHAVAIAPASRPALRYQAIFEARAGNLDRAAAAIRRLTALENGFEIRQIADDPDYPVASLRRSNLPNDVLRSLY